MSNTQYIYIVLSLLVMFFLGFYFRDFMAGNTPLHDLPLTQKSCTYNNVTYKSGDGFMDKDGCNQCGCTDGEVACTAMACENSDSPAY